MLLRIYQFCHNRRHEEATLSLCKCNLPLIYSIYILWFRPSCSGMRDIGEMIGAALLCRTRALMLWNFVLEMGMEINHVVKSIALHTGRLLYIFLLIKNFIKIPTYLYAMTTNEICSCAAHLKLKVHLICHLCIPHHRSNTTTLLTNYSNTQKRFPCRSAEYEYGSMRCALSDSDRRTAQHFVQLVDTPGTDYFEVSFYYKPYNQD